LTTVDQQQLIEIVYERASKELHETGKLTPFSLLVSATTECKFIENVPLQRYRESHIREALRKCVRENGTVVTVLVSEVEVVPAWEDDKPVQQPTERQREEVLFAFAKNWARNLMRQWNIRRDC